MARIKIMTAAIERQLDANGRQRGKDHVPVLKLFLPWGAATWLITERDPDEPDHLFGLCDLGFGTPELGTVSLSELQSVRGPFGLTLERDIHWQGDKPLSEYAAEARAKGRIAA